MKNLNDGVHLSPNIQTDSDIYELENKACDPEHRIESFLKSIFNWSGKNVLDIGCGTAFHLPYFSKEAKHVFGVEPHDSSRIKGMKRIVEMGLENVSVIKGSAETIRLEDNFIDFAYARFAYFWGKGCEKGLKEVFRVLNSGGIFIMIDNNLERGTFGSWVKESFNFSDSKQAEVEDFWKNNGFKLKVIDSKWQFQNRKDLEKVLSIEFPDEVYKKIVKSHTGLSIDYTFNLYYKLK